MREHSEGVTADAEDTAAPHAPRTRSARRAHRRRRSLARDLTALGVIGALLIGAFGATAVVLYNDLYGPSAFVTRYLGMLSSGNAAEALEVPGVRVDSSALTRSDLPADASEALLRRAALAPLSDIQVASVETAEDGTTAVTVTYAAGPHRGTTVFHVQRAGWVGVAPTWRFATSPLAAIDLTVRGATRFTVNGFEVDTRQVSPDGVEANPLDPVSLLVFSPGLYSISVDTPISTSPGVGVLSDKPLAAIPVSLQTQPTATFLATVEEKVSSFLTDCATQQVLQPTGCPFGLVVQNRIATTPAWSIAQQPTITLLPDGANWKIERTTAAAHITVDILSIFDGKVRTLDEAVPFTVGGTVTILPDGTASIQFTDGG